MINLLLTALLFPFFFFFSLLFVRFIVLRVLSPASHLLLAPLLTAFPVGDVALRRCHIEAVGGRRRIRGRFTDHLTIYAVKKDSITDESEPAGDLNTQNSKGDQNGE